MNDDILTITATEFKAKCLAIFDQLDRRRLSRVVVTRRGRPVAELIPPTKEVPSLRGSMKGTVTFVPGVDLTEPVFDGKIDAEEGILYNE